MLLIDVHAHLDLKEFDSDLDEVIKRAETAGVKAIISNGINHKSNRKTLELSKKYKIVKPALGLYPDDAITLTQEQLQNELNFIKKNKDKIIAIGEVGLDYKYCKKKQEQELQKEIFLKIINISKKINKPLIIHSRKAEPDVIDILENSDAKKVILHCFSGKLKLIKKAAKLGFYFSVPTNITYSQHFQKLAEIVDINKLLTETDSPYLSPYKNRRNEPSFIIEAIKKIAEIKNTDINETANNIFMNYQKIFFR
ncbi:MAG: TatD family hydrolase [Nanoarchaeota archaeon]|nr:TatD family hydrolase [Nanoarchaeota archaeon]